MTTYLNKSPAQRRRAARLAGVLAATVSVVLTTLSTCLGADLGLIDVTALRGAASKWVILDARPKADWEAGHIPGAVHFSWESYTRTDAKGVKYSSLSPQELAVAFARLGIDEKTPLVVYGDANKSWGAEGYGAWLFSWLGHKGAIRLLNGGIKAWQSRNLPLAKGPEKGAPPKARYRPDPNPELIVSTEEIQKGSAAYILIDTRSTFEWIRGKIPGAIHISWEEFYTGDDRHPLSAAELNKLLAKNGVKPGRPVVFYCLGGVRSAYAWTTYQLAGLPDGRNYRGGWAAWEKRSGQ